MPAAKRKAESTTAANDSKKPKKDSSLTSFFGAPKITPSNAKGGSSTAPEEQGAAAKFDKDKWVATLSDEQKKLLQLEIDTLDPTWLSHLKEEITKPGFLELKRFINKEIESGKTVFPPLPDVYSWSRHTPLNTVKAVILGQDPYHNHNQAHGLCFSVRPPTPAPPSLVNMYKELKSDYPSFKAPPNRGGLLTPWAEQGVLMINTCLTVRAHEANSHRNKGWEAFTQKVIDTVAKVRSRGVVFIAWGGPAQKRCAKITGAKHYVLKGVHPSPLSANGTPGFFGCAHFKKTNDWLEERYGEEGIINWDLNNPAPIKKPGDSNQPLKAADEKKSSTESKDGAKAEEPKVQNKKAAAKEDEFDDDEDEDALEAMNELAKSEASASFNSTAAKPDEKAEKDDKEDKENKENEEKNEK